MSPKTNSTNTENQMIRQLRLGLAAIAIAAAGLFMAAPASAQTAVNCANAPSGLVTGNLIIVDDPTSPACNITHSISATQNISIQAPGPITITGNVTMPQPTSTTYGTIYIETPQSVKITGNISTTPTTISSPGGGTIVINAGGTLQTGTITSKLGGYIILEAQKQGGNMPFVVGTSGTNGVGKISTSGTNDGVHDYSLMGSTAVYIVNGNSASTGGITITAVADLVVANGGGGRAGALILNAQNGTLKVPGGFTLAGTNNLVGGGFITFLANTVQFTAVSTLNVSQNTAMNPTPYNTQINIAAETIKYSTLTLNANGIGVPKGYHNIQNTYPAGVFLLSQNQLGINDSQTVVNDILTGVEITVDPTGAPLSSLTLMGTGALTVTANGNTAQAVVRAAPVNIQGTNVSLSSTGSTNHGVYVSNQGSGSAITFGNSGTVTLNASGVKTSTATTTDGGYVYVKGDQISFNAKTFVISATGPATGAGDGGIVDIEANNQLSLGSAFLGAKVSANAAAASTGKAQKALIVPAISDTIEFPAITIDPGSAPSLILGNGTSGQSFNLTANGGKTGGNAGKIFVDGFSTNITVNTALAVNASALSTTADGDGGEIQINGLITSLSTTATMQAIGQKTGEGGRVSINNNTAALDVNFFVKVDGGKSIASSDFDGKITINLVVCQQYLTSTSSATTFPITYWNCVNTEPNAPTSLDMVPSQLVLSNLSSTLRAKGNNRIYLYVFNNQSNFQTFFNQTTAEVGAGATWHSTKTTPNVYSSVWESTTSGGTYSQSTFSEITMHEMGHAFDYVLGQNLQSGYAKFIQFVLNDFFTLDYVTNAGPPVTYSLRSPCVNSGTVQAPFANIPQVCTGTTLNPIYAGMKNSQILQSGAVGEYWFTTQVNDFGKDGWAELYAQSLAYVAYAAGSGFPYAYIVPDNIFVNSFFRCTREWSTNIQAGITTAPVDTMCSRVVPTP